MPRLNPAQHRLLQRHVDRAMDTLQEADRLLGGAARDLVSDCVAHVGRILERIELEESNTVTFRFDDLPVGLVKYLDDPFAQGLAFNRFCARKRLSHTRGTKAWEGGNAAVAARNLVFLPPVYHDLWEAGLLDKTRLASIANRNLTEEAYHEVAELVRTRRREDVDARLLKMPATALRIGRRGPEQALEAAERNGWTDMFRTVEIPEDFVQEAVAIPEEAEPDETPADQAARALRAGLSGARLSDGVVENLRLSPDPMALIDKFLIAHRKTGDPDPEELTKTVFYAHAGPMQKLVADDKLLLRHFRPVKTQKRGQLFYRLLEVIEERMQERQHVPELEERGLDEAEAAEAVGKVVRDLNSDPNRFLVIPDEWLGEVTRRHLYFGSRTRKEGAAYKWFRKIGSRYFLGSHKTSEELAERRARRADTV